MDNIQQGNGEEQRVYFEWFANVQYSIYTYIDTYTYIYIYIYSNL